MIIRLLRRLLPSPRTARGKAAIVAFLASFAVLASTTAGYAYWTAGVSATGTVGAASLALSTTNFTSVGYTFGNESLVTTGGVTVTNTTTTTSTRAGAVSLTFGPDTVSTLAGKVTLTLWPTASVANCTAAATVPSGATSALWSASTSVSTTLAAGAGASYCVRSSIASRETVALAGGSLTFAPKISGTITVGNFTGSTSATTTQTTHYIYPSATANTANWNWLRPKAVSADYDYCVDVSGGGASDSGTPVISFGCKSSGAINQQWKFIASGVAGYYTIEPRNATGLRIDNGSSMSSGAGINVVSAGTASTAKNQQWQLQLISAGVYEIVSASSGMCMTSPTGTGENLGQLSQTPCDGGSDQQFLISQAFESFGCSATTSAWKFTWTSAATGPYHVALSGSSTDLAVTASATATGISIPTTGYARGYSATVIFTDANGTAVGTGTIARAATGTSYSCSAIDPQS